MRIYLSILGIALLSLWHSTAHAEQGKVGLAYPVRDITVDGNLDDWPDELIRYPLLHNDDGAPILGESDFKGEFRIGYQPEENALYVGVDVQDDDVVIQGHGGQGWNSQEWNSQDGCELYIYGHKPGENAPTQYRLWGEHRGVYGPGTLEEVQIEVDWREDGYSIEWRIDLDLPRSAGSLPPRWSAAASRCGLASPRRRPEGYGTHDLPRRRTGGTARIQLRRDGTRPAGRRRGGPT